MNKIAEIESALKAASQQTLEEIMGGAFVVHDNEGVLSLGADNNWATIRPRLIDKKPAVELQIVETTFDPHAETWGSLTFTFIDGILTSRLAKTNSSNPEKRRSSETTYAVARIPREYAVRRISRKTTTADPLKPDAKIVVETSRYSRTTGNLIAKQSHAYDLWTNESFGLHNVSGPAVIIGIEHERFNRDCQTHNEFYYIDGARFSRDAWTKEISDRRTSLERATRHANAVKGNV